MEWKNVFDSSKVFPEKYAQCLKIAKSVGYEYLAFNGFVYSINDPNMNRPICSTDEM